LVQIGGSLEGAYPHEDWLISETTAWFSHWLRHKALPLWETSGRDPTTGGFLEGLEPHGAPFDPFRRSRVQSRQAFVYAAMARGSDDPRLAMARGALDFLGGKGRRGDGLYVTRLTPGGDVLDGSVRLYDQSFVLLALAAVARADLTDSICRAQAAELRAALETFRHPCAGYRETGDFPFQANAQMHLLEATLAWEEVDGHAAWRGVSDEIADLALTRFVTEQGVLNEFYDPHWQPLKEEAGLVEPGHMFEWAWLLDRWGERRRSNQARSVARSLFEAGRAGRHPTQGVVVNALWSDLTPRDSTARLWPQTEYLKAAIRLGKLGDARFAAAGLARYLDYPLLGAWRDLLLDTGRFRFEPAPASSLYHLLLAVLELEKLSGYEAQASATVGGPRDRNRTIQPAMENERASVL
jgi:mannose-1-phosphate guanylyltransferase/mannose-6-phosphate isomerase